MERERVPMVDFLGRSLKDGDKVVYANYDYNPDRLFSKPLHKGTIIGHVSHESYSDLTVQTEGGYIDKVCSYDAVKVD